MYRSTPFSITVAKLCHQSWDDMTPNSDGRHCNECSKTVVDFTDYSDAELIAFFSKTQDRVCGRFRATQLSRQLHIPPQPHSRLYRLTVALGLTLFFAYPSHVAGQSVRSAPLIEARTSGKMPQGTSGDVVGMLSGSVVDQRGRPVDSASVYIYSSGSYLREVLTNKAGVFSAGPFAYGLYDIVIQARGHEFISIKNLRLDSSKSTMPPYMLCRSPKRWPAHEIVTGESMIDTNADSIHVPRNDDRNKARRRLK
jgi:hypothetical protein